MLLVQNEGVRLEVIMQTHLLTLECKSKWFRLAFNLDILNFIMLFLLALGCF